MTVPEAFEKQIRILLGDEADALLEALDNPAPVSIRVNPGKMHHVSVLPDPEFPRAQPPQLCGRERQSVIAGWPPIRYVTGTIPWSNEGLYLNERPAFIFDPLWHAGCYYVQEASSMFVDQALRKALVCLDAENEPVRMLDLCAAPGGKSTHALSVLPPGSLLVANEMVRTRANILAENLIKWGKPNVVVTQNEPSAFAGTDGFFDIILTDVPCSGEGMFRKDPVSISEWSPSIVVMCADRQRTILKNSLNALKPGGMLIYSTCTYNTAENEENMRWLCETFGYRLIPIPLDSTWLVTGSLMPGDMTLPVYRFLPHKTKGEGFFLALLQKPDGEHAVVRHPRAAKGGRNEKASASVSKQPVMPEFIRRMLLSYEDFHFYTDKSGRISAFPLEQAEALLMLQSSLRILYAGMVLGETKGNDFLPDPSLALSLALNRQQVPTCPLELKQAIAFLRRESLALPDDCPLGWVLMLYEDHPLGWMKNIGNRANNGWPNEWRIRSENPYI